MPERPDLEYVVPRLRAALVGRELGPPRVRKPVVLRALASELTGRVSDVARRGHTVVITLEPDVEIVISPMLAGRFLLVPVGTRDSADLAVAWPLSGEREELRYRDDVQMGKIYLTPRGVLPQGVPAVGVDALSPEFDVPRLTALLAKRREQIKVVLMDKSALDALGNAYGDEVLWEAQIHPKIAACRLTATQIEALHSAIVQVLTHARDEIARRAPPLDEKLRDFLHVRGRVGPCDRCGTRLRTLGVHGHDAYYCPQCQSETGGVVRKGIVDWKKLTKTEDG